MNYDKNFLENVADDLNMHINWDETRELSDTVMNIMDNCHYSYETVISIVKLIKENKIKSRVVKNIIKEMCKDSGWNRKATKELVTRVKYLTGFDLETIPF